MIDTNERCGVRHSLGFVLLGALGLVSLVGCGSDPGAASDSEDMKGKFRIVLSVPEESANIDVFRVAQSIVLGQNAETDKTVRAVVLDNGSSTDVSPRYHLYITYMHAAELNNTSTAFDLG